MTWLWRRKSWLLFALLVAAGGVAAASSLRGPKVKTVAVARRAIVQRVIATGRVEPPARVTIGSQVAGTAVKVGPEEGEKVRAGEVLVELDSAEAIAAVEQAQAGVAAAQAKLVQMRGTGALIASEALRQAEITLQSSEANLARFESLFRSASITQKELDEARKQADLAKSQRESARLQAAASSMGGPEMLFGQATLAQAQAALSQAKAKLAHTKLLAPADAVVLTRDVEPGDIVTVGKPLYVLAREGKTRLVAQPDEKSLAFLAVGQAALASVDAFPTQRFEATIASIAPAVDPARGTIEIKLDVLKPPAYLRADMTVSIDVEVGRAADALVLPADVVLDAAGAAPWVWALENGRLRKRPIQLGLRGEGSVQVTAGLADGERVVAADGKPLKAGQEVRPEPRDAS